MHADLYGVPKSEMKSQIDKMLELIELSDRSNDFVRNYRATSPKSDEQHNAAVNFIFKRIGRVRKTGAILESIK